MLGTILSLLFTGFAVGGLARWAVPGPDPMPVWLTVAIGLGGSIVGGGVVALVLGANKNVSSSDYFSIILASILAAAGIVILYRRFVQGRPVTGPEAHKLPTRGVGVSRMRDRLRRVGVDPDSVGSPGGPKPVTRDETGETLRKLEELHDAGLLTDEEFEQKKAQILSRP